MSSQNQALTSKQQAQQGVGQTLRTAWLNIAASGTSLLLPKQLAQQAAITAMRSVWGAHGKQLG